MKKSFGESVHISSTNRLFFMFMMFMWVASVSTYTSFNFGKNPVLMPIFIAILIYFYGKFCRKSFVPLALFLFVFFVWNILNLFKYSGFIGTNFPIFYSVLIAHVALNIYTGSEFFEYFERILVFFCLVSLIVWGMSNFWDGFLNVAEALSVIERNPPTETYSFLFGLGTQVEAGFRRNIGFTWEPGRFSCWCLLGIYVNLVRHKFKITPLKNNKGFYIILVSLLTTFSTTGYFVMFLLLFFYFKNKKSFLVKFLLISLSICVLPIILSLPFMLDKVVELLDPNLGYEEVYEYGIKKGYDTVTPQRFSGILFSCSNFLNDFWLGYNKIERSYISVLLGTVVTPSEGIFYMLARYGFLVGIFLYVCLIKSSFFWAEKMHYKGGLMFFVLFIALSFSYEFWENCIFMVFYLSSFYVFFDKRYLDEDRSIAKTVVV